MAVVDEPSPNRRCGASTVGIDQLAGPAIEDVVGIIRLLGNHASVVLEHDSRQPIAVIPSELGGLVWSRSRTDPSPRLEIPFVIVRIIEHAIARQSVIRSSRIASMGSIPSRIVTVGFVSEARVCDRSARN